MTVGKPIPQFNIFDAGKALHDHNFFVESFELEGKTDCSELVLCLKTIGPDHWIKMRDLISGLGDYPKQHDF